MSVPSSGPVKYVVCVPDGCADEPDQRLGGRTPLEVAHTPVLDALARRGTVGRAGVIPEGLPPGSDVGNLAILGYDPAVHHTGRAPIEAAALGLCLDADHIAFRCNLVTVADDGTMVDFAGGHPDSAAAAAVIADLDATLGARSWSLDGHEGRVSFHAGVQYRHTVVAPAAWADVECVPPHDLTGQPALAPRGPAAEPVQALMEASREVLARHPEVAATQIWLWGQGPQPRLEPFRSRWGIEAGIVTAVDLVRGLGVLTRMSVVEVEGATGWYDTDYEAKRDAALEHLAAGLDLFVIHVEASDEAGHAGDADEKIRALENWDRRILAGLVEGLDALGPWRLLLLPDHATPLRLRTHTSDPVPYLLVDSTVDGPGGVYSERGVADRPLVAGHELMGRLLGR